MLSPQNSSTCWVCNGYYGPNFGEPFCGACHSFLFACVEEQPRVTELSEDDDDEDSGNDEPPYNPAAVAVAAPAVQEEEDENMEEGDEVQDDEDVDEVPEDMIDAAIAPEAAAAAAAAIGNQVQLPLVRPRANAPRNLLQYLDLLSIPRQNNDRNDPRIEALATEGTKEDFN